MFEELRANPRLRMGLALALALVLVVVLNDWRVAIGERGRAVGREQARLEATAERARDTAWSQRAQEARAAREKFEASLWQAGSVGAAEAMFVDWMNREMGAAKVNNLNVIAASLPGGNTPGQAAIGPTLPAGTALMRLSVSFEFAPGVVERVLDRLAQTDRYLVVEGLTVRRRPLARVEMVVSSLARPIAEKSAAAEQKGGAR